LVAGILVFGATAVLVLPSFGWGSGAPWLSASIYATWLAVWGLVALPIPAVASWAIYGSSPRTIRPSWLSITAVVVATCLGFALYEWIRQRLGYFTLESSGASGLLPPVLLAAATLSEARERSPAGLARRLVIALQMALLFGAWVILLLNLPGLFDGVRPASSLLAATFGLAVGWAFWATGQNVLDLRASRRRLRGAGGGPVTER
jgi:hypothetical protein